ncbi:MAG: HAMP domain-containing sensor histidine kinase [Hyphomonadaceae bacterium]
MNTTNNDDQNPVSTSSQWMDGLSVRLLCVTIGVILLVELFIFIPSAVNYRDNWIDDRVQAARIATLALDASEGGNVSGELAAQLLANAEVLSVAEVGQDTRRLLLSAPHTLDAKMNLVDRRDESWMTRARHLFSLLTLSGDSVVSVTDISNDEDTLIEVTIDEMPLASEISDFSGRIIVLSLLLSVTAGVLVYLFLVAMVVRPMGLLTQSIINFHNDPGASRALSPKTERKDQIGRAQNALSDMEEEVSNAFRQRKRLAELGEAIAKINHDLRNSLATAQLVSEGLARSEDPRVKRAAPRLERVLERAINLTEDTLQYGKARKPEPKMQIVNLHAIIDEAAREAMQAFPALGLKITVPTDTEANVDEEHLHRVVANLVRNAAQATAAARPEDGKICIDLDGSDLLCRDNGPGLPDNALENLFTPFAGSNTKGGTGLGLAIARELVQSMGGDVHLETTGPSGTIFRIALPGLINP